MNVSLGDSTGARVWALTARLPRLGPLQPNGGQPWVKNRAASTSILITFKLASFWPKILELQLAMASRMSRRRWRLMGNQLGHTCWLLTVVLPPSSRLHHQWRGHFHR